METLAKTFGGQDRFGFPTVRSRHWSGVQAHRGQVPPPPGAQAVLSQ